MAIPVVDFAGFLHGSQDEKLRVANEIFTAFETVGFVYLKNYTEITEKSKHIFELSKKFFALPESEKLKVSRGKHPDDVLGYIPFGAEGLSNDDIDPKNGVQAKPTTDAKESYQMYNESMVPPFKNRWPEIPGFREKMEDFFEACQIAHLNVMSCIAIGLGLEEKYFDGAMDKKANAIRLLHYPFSENANIKRAGAHTDYGSITLLFQDSVGGLQVRNTSGEFADARPIPDTIVVNVADMLQRWSNDRLKSTLHRVVSPANSSGNLPERFSIAYFATPNLDLTIECLPKCEGSSGSKYPPINSGEYLMGRIQGHY
eukprot:Phypoly_transcript_13280.p1 GENE.Phypoly_transcript_13280~~Phypoly_transcript_13280.p1  ORF type:complete len:340 (+),score=40.77 Phypoly_transcript_13280:77-1021(+)